MTIVTYSKNVMTSLMYFSGLEKSIWSNDGAEFYIGLFDPGAIDGKALD